MKVDVNDLSNWWVTQKKRDIKSFFDNEAS